MTECTEEREIMYYNQCEWLNSLFWCLLWVSRMYKCKQHIHELFSVASRFLKKIICNELYLCTRNKDGIRRILNCKCTGDFWLLCIAQRISSSISALILNMQSWLCLLCSSYFSLQQSGLESVRRARCRVGNIPPWASLCGPAAGSEALPCFVSLPWPR